jgi:hypothetical protein
MQPFVSLPPGGRRSSNYEQNSNVVKFVVFRTLLLYPTSKFLGCAKDRLVFFGSSFSKNSQHVGIESHFRYPADETFRCSSCGTSHNLTELRKTIQLLVGYQLVVDEKYCGNVASG